MITISPSSPKASIEPSIRPSSPWGLLAVAPRPRLRAPSVTSTFLLPFGAWGCVKSHFLCYKSPPGARMASLQNDFFDFLGLFTQPLYLLKSELNIASLQVWRRYFPIRVHIGGLQAIIP